MNCVDYFFEETLSLDKKFIVGNEEFSFAELYEQTNKLAHYLNSQVGTGENILLLSVNSGFFVSSYLGIMKSGNTCVPLDPRIEAKNLDYIINETNPTLIILTPDVAKRINTNIECLLPEDILGLKGVLSDQYKKDIDFDSNTTAEVIFTSGSTGLPKGVMLSHKNLIANTKSIVEYLELTSNDRMMVVMPFFYCYGLSLLHTHLRVGGSIIFNNSFIFLGKIITDLKNYCCTGFAGVPSHFQILLRKSESFKNTDFPDLRYVTQAGGKLSTVFIDEFRLSFPGTKFFVMYGQTEATARLSYLPPDVYEEKKGSLGKGIPGVTLKVINKEGTAVKPGEVGEIIAYGDNIMKGYLNHPEETFKTIKEGWLYTGDLGIVDNDGFIYHAGRIKEIMKIAGKRVSPKEIEDVILRIPEVVDCSIEAIEDEVQGEAIKATVIVNNLTKNTLTEKNIKEHCSHSLVAYKIPSTIEFREKMQLSSSGKKVKTKL